MVIPEYEGHVEAALSLRTDAGDVPLLRDGVGTLLEKVDDAPGTNGRRRADEEIDLRENARAYLAGANPKDAPAPDTGAPMIAPGGLLKAAEGALRERREAERADGSYRLEWKFPVAPREIDLSGRYLEETYLPPQEPCWVFGVWSGEPSGVRVRRIVLGERGSVVGTLLLGSVGYLVMGAVVSAFFAFVVRTFLRSS